MLLGVDSQGPRWSTAIAEADWLGGALAEFGTIVTSVVPKGFAAYARILHPAEVPGRGRRLVRWAEVAAWSGMPLGPRAQFHSVALPPRRPEGPAPWSGQGPELGSLYAGDASALARTLRRFTATPERCWFCIWEGHGFQGRPLVAPGQAAPELPSPIPAEVWSGPRVHLPHRDYLLYEGAVEAVTATVGLAHLDQTANLWWPSDHAWAVASELDLACTYVGGPAELVEAIVRDTAIEALAAAPDDPLAHVEDWVARWADSAVDQLLGTGDATVETSRGTVQAHLTRPTRLRAGRLQTTRTGDNGVTGGVAARIDRKTGTELRRVLTSYMTKDVIELVGG